MNNQTILLLILFTIIGCGKDDNSNQNPEIIEITYEEFKFTAEIRSSAETKFVLVTDDLGNRYVDTIESNGTSQYIFDKIEGTKINVTIGGVSDNWFSILTYRDIENGSTIMTDDKWESQECFNTQATNYESEAKIIIEGIDNYYHITSAFQYNDEPILSPNEITLEGYIVVGRDLQIVIQETLNSKPKSLIVSFENWQLNSDSKLEQKVSFQDFKETNRYLIPVNKNQSWISNISGCRTNENIVDLDRWTDWRQNQDGDSIILHVDKSLNISDYKFQISNDAYQRLLYSWIHPSVPSNINFPDLDSPVFLHLSLDSFLIESTNEYNINVAEYRFDKKIQNRWSIISEGGDNFGFKLPELPNVVKHNYQYISEKMSLPSYFRNHMIKNEMQNFNSSDYKLEYINEWNSPDYNFILKMTNTEIE